MKLIAYPAGHLLPKLMAAPAERFWMSETPEGFANRCLPLRIANGHGWELLCPYGITAFWTGGDHSAAVQIHTDEQVLNHIVLSHFGCGILTFNISWLFRTAPGYNLYVTGPVNRPKDGIAALTGVVETDWTCSTFTMNWLFTRPDHPVRFAKDEPFCHIFPVKRSLIEDCEPEIRLISDDPVTEKAFLAFCASRAEFLRGLSVGEEKAVKEKWQKDYFQGKGAPPDHQTKLKAAEFKLP